MSLPAIPAELLHLCETEREAVRRYAEAYALQAVEALRREPMTEEQILDVCDESSALGIVAFLHGVRAAEAHHHITQKEQG